MTKRISWLPMILLLATAGSVYAQAGGTLMWDEDPASIVTGYAVTIDGVRTDYGLSPVAPQGTCSCAIVLPFSGGRHVITVIAYNSSGETASAPLTIGPTANAGGPYSGQSGTPLAVTAGGSQAPTGSLVSYLWAWGDASSNTTVTAPQASHTYAASGTFTITLTVTDNAGATSQATTTAAVTGGAAFTATATASPSSITASESSTISFSVTDTGAALSNANVEVQVLNPSGVAVGTGVFGGQNFTANGTLSFTYVWTPSAQNPSVTAAGNYTVGIGVFNSSWSANYYWNASAATITMTAPTAATPAFSPAAGTYTSAQSVTISDTTPGAVIYYTTDGVTPTASSTRYTGAVAVSSTETIQAIAVASGYYKSAVASALYTINVGTPTFTATATANPSSIARSGSATISFSITDTGAALSNANVEVQVFNASGTAVGTGVFGGQNFTANGTLPFTYVWTPSAQNPSVTAAGNYTVEIGVFNSAWSTVYYWNNNAATIILTATAAATPTFSPAAGTYTSAQSVTISDTTAGATIYYTTNGATPTASSTRYTGAIGVSSTETIKAIAMASGASQSTVASALYTININVGPPTFSATATVNPISIVRSGSSTVSFSVKDTGGALSNANVEVQVFNSSGVAVGTAVFAGQNFTANGTLTFRYIWTPAAQNPAVTAAGKYTVEIGVFDSAWSTLYYWNSNAATITLQ